MLFLLLLVDLLLFLGSLLVLFAFCFFGLVIVRNCGLPFARFCLVFWYLFIFGPFLHLRNASAWTYESNYTILDVTGHSTGTVHMVDGWRQHVGFQEEGYNGTRAGWRRIPVATVGILVIRYNGGCNRDCLSGVGLARGMFGFWNGGDGRMDGWYWSVLLSLFS